MSNVGKHSLVIYHHPCSDGTSAACVAFLNQTMKNKFCRLYPTNYGKDIPEESVYENRDVFIVDFSYCLEEIKQIASKATKVVVIDHHKSRQKELESMTENLKNIGINNIEVIFDINKSGAALTHKYLYPENDLPKLIQYVQDRDLWKWELPHSKEINAYIRSFELDIFEYNRLAKELEEKFYECVKSGSSILRFQSKEVKEICSKSRIVEFEGYKVPVVNHFSSLISEIGAFLNQGQPFAIVYYQEPDKNWIYSLRSSPIDCPENVVDVSEIAKKYGGGGHKRAAGFKSEELLF